MMMMGMMCWAFEDGEEAALLLHANDLLTSLLLGGFPTSRALQIVVPQLIWTRHQRRI